MRELREILEYHALMLADSRRVDAYRDAIERTVRPGDVVVDIGTGTGILALMAARAGARRVYALEAGTAADLAERVLAANDGSRAVVLMRGRSHDLTLPEPADVLVSEIMWNAGLGEGILGTYADAQERLLKPDARVVPRSLQVWLAPVESPRAYETVDAWSPTLAGFDYSAIRGVAANVPYPRYFRAEAAVAAAACAGTIDLTARLHRTHFVGECEFTAARDATLHGLVGWFASNLAPDVWLDNAPPSRGSWMQAYFPVERPVGVGAHEPIAARIAVLAADEHWQWTVEAGGVRQQGWTLAPRLQSRP